MEYSHRAVLLDEVLEALNIRPDGFYVDCTFGCGGHSGAILKRLDESGRLLAIDRDPDAVRIADSPPFRDRRFRLVQGSYCMLSDLVHAGGMQGKTDGILFDLGVSSPQFDNPGRGFSFQHNGVLDMRMDPADPVSARDWLNQAKQSEIADVIYRYGEERFARRIAKRIVSEREKSPLGTTHQLAKLVASVYPKRSAKGIHPATKTFQAIRIFINNELKELKEALSQVIDLLAPGGRLVAISFHSLEDRIIKRFIREQGRGGTFPPDLPIRDDQLRPGLKPVGKPIRPATGEVESNPRARSAIMRIGERI